MFAFALCSQICSPMFDSVEKLQNINANFGNPFWMEMDMEMSMHQMDMFPVPPVA